MLVSVFQFGFAEAATGRAIVSQTETPTPDGQATPTPVITATATIDYEVAPVAPDPLDPTRMAEHGVPTLAPAIDTESYDIFEIAGMTETLTMTINFGVDDFAELTRHVRAGASMVQRVPGFSYVVFGLMVLFGIRLVGSVASNATSQDSRDGGSLPPSVSERERR